MQGREAVVPLAVALAVMVSLVASENHCDYNTCSECIGAPSCVWCSDPNITLIEADAGTTLTHCISDGSYMFEEFVKACKDAISNPVTVSKIIEDEELSEESKIQLKPQQVRLEMRVGNSARIPIKYKHLSNYPLDVYCLMDGSKSMSILQTDLSKLTNELVKGLEKVSNNMQLGFGMFVDKPMLPFTDMFSWRGQTCGECVETFSFKNILPLTSDHEAFQIKVESTKGSTSTDLPEGTLDALMQVASCSSKVGWRDIGVRVVVVFTDAGFHTAGDGRLAGITRPNDKKCHLNDEGHYTMSKLQDYPSISELKSVLEPSNVFTTFAVKQHLVPLYNVLASQLPRSDCSDIKENSSNIVSIITDFAQASLSKVDLKEPKDIMPELEVKVTSLCPGEEEETIGGCNDMKPGDEAVFFINIKANHCPEVERQTTTLNFTLDGYGQSFIVDLKLLCQCDCDREEDEGFIHNAERCSSNGDLRCGVCACHDGFLGNKCQCGEGDTSHLGVDEKNCINPNASTNLLCSGQGQCVCGQCECDKNDDPTQVIRGQYCQCTNYKNCYGANGKICSGNGECVCDKCYCSDVWTGEHCECQNSTTECLMPDEEEVCSSHGECVCNQCQCEVDYLGKYCQDCQNCQKKCDEHKPCVQCLVFDKGNECKDDCSSYNVTIVTDMSEKYGQLCSSMDDDGCRFLYQFKHTRGQVLLWADQQRECPTKINPWAVVGGVLGAVLVVGLVLLIAWKVITQIKDKREYQAFLKNKNMAIWSENMSPIYKPATTMVQNPLFEAGSAGQN